jgi:hypothetical protein
MQQIVSTLIVTACAAYAAWALLLPATWKLRARRALKLKAPTGCAGCDGCAGDAAPARQAAPQVVHWMPRRRDRTKVRR